MGELTSAIQQLRALPISEREDQLESLVTDEFKATLLMPEDEELPLTESFFDLGLTSLLLGEVKDRLERVLGCQISTTQLFNKPTVEQLMTHLTTKVLADHFDRRTGNEHNGPAPQGSDLWDDLWKIAR
jgi:acyl carrier protein